MSGEGASGRPADVVVEEIVAKGLIYTQNLMNLQLFAFEKLIKVAKLLLITTRLRKVTKLSKLLLIILEELIFLSTMLGFCETGLLSKSTTMTGIWFMLSTCGDLLLPPKQPGLTSANKNMVVLL